MTKDKKPPFHFDLGIVLLVTGAVSNITIWIGAFVSTETEGPITTWVHAYLLPVLGGLSGLAMGFTVSAGLVYVIARLNKMRPTTDRKVRGKKKYQTLPNVRFYGAWAAVILLLVISAGLLSPYVYMLGSGIERLFLVLDSWAGAWSVGRIVAADLALGAVAMVQGVHLGASAMDGHAPRTETPATQSGVKLVRSAKGATVSATVSATPAKEMRPCNVPGCGIPYTWPQGKGAHYKKHHPDLVIQKGIPAKVSLPIREDEKKQMVKSAEVQKESSL